MPKAMTLVSDRTKIQAHTFLKACILSNRPSCGDLKDPGEFCENSKVRNHETQGVGWCASSIRSTCSGLLLETQAILVSSFHIISGYTCLVGITSSQSHGADKVKWIWWCSKGSQAPLPSVRFDVKGGEKWKREGAGVNDWIMKHEPHALSRCSWGSLF